MATRIRDPSAQTIVSHEDLQLDSNLYTLSKTPINLKHLKTELVGFDIEKGTEILNGFLWLSSALTELGAFMRTEFLCVSVLRVASGPRVKLASCKSALNPTAVYSTDRSKAVVPVLVLLFVALWFILRGDLLCVFPCIILFLCSSVLLVLRLPRLGKRELILVLFVRLFDFCLFGFVGFLFLLGYVKGCGL